MITGLQYPTLISPFFCFPTTRLLPRLLTGVLCGEPAYIAGGAFMVAFFLIKRRDPRNPLSVSQLYIVLDTTLNYLAPPGVDLGTTRGVTP